MPCPVGTKCAPKNYDRTPSSEPGAVRKRAWRRTQDPQRLRDMNREHQRAKRERDRAI